MILFDIDITCRLCASQVDKEKALAIFEEPFKLSSIGEMMLDCLLDEIQPKSGYPEVVCQYCQLQLNVFFEFKRKVLEQQEKFRLIIRENTKREKIIKEVLKHCPSTSVETQSDKTEDMVPDEAHFKTEVFEEVYDHETDGIDTIHKERVSKLEITEQEADQEETELLTIDFESELEASSAKSDFCKSLDVEYLDVFESKSPLYDNAGNDHFDEQYLEPVDECFRSILPDVSDQDAEDSEDRMTIEYIDEDGLAVSEDEARDMSRIHAQNQYQQIKIQCEICEKFVSPQQMENHINRFHIRNFVCSICSKGFTTQTQLTAHEFRHSNLRPLSCALCEKTFKLKCDLRVHMNCHMDVRKYSCDICGKSFRSHSHMTDHRETHNTVNKLPCPECGLLFKTSVTLKSHIKQVHNDNHANKCSICDRTFYRRNKLEKHLLSHEKKARKLLMK